MEKRKLTWLARQRQKAGHTQEVMAALCGVAQGSISKAENLGQLPDDLRRWLKPYDADGLRPILRVPR